MAQVTGHRKSAKSKEVVRSASSGRTKKHSKQLKTSEQSGIKGKNFDLSNLIVNMPPSNVYGRKLEMPDAPSMGYVYGTKLNVPNAATLSRTGSNVGNVSPSYHESASYRQGLSGYPMTLSDLEKYENDIDKYWDAMKAIGAQPEHNGLISERDLIISHQIVMKQFQPETSRALRQHLFTRIAGVKSQDDPLPATIRAKSELGKMIETNKSASHWQNLKIFMQECKAAKLKQLLDRSHDGDAEKRFDMAYHEVKQRYEQKAIAFEKYNQEDCSDLQIYESLYIDPMKDRLRHDNLIFKHLRNLGCNLDGDDMKELPGRTSLVMEPSTPVPKATHKRRSSMSSGLVTATQLSKNDIGKLDDSEIEIKLDEIMENLTQELGYYEKEIEMKKRLANEQSATALDARIDDWIEKAKLLFLRKHETEKKEEQSKKEEKFYQVILQFEARKAKIFDKHRKLSLTTPKWSDTTTPQVSVQREIDRQSIHFDQTLVSFLNDSVKHQEAVKNLQLSKPRDERTDLEIVREILEQASIFVKENDNSTPGSYTFKLKSAYNEFRKMNAIEYLKSREYWKQLDKMDSVYRCAMKQFGKIMVEISENVIRFNDAVRLIGGGSKAVATIEVSFGKEQSVITTQRTDKQKAKERGKTTENAV